MQFSKDLQLISYAGGINFLEMTLLGVSTQYESNERPCPFSCPQLLQEHSATFLFNVFNSSQDSCIIII